VRYANGGGLTPVQAAEMFAKDADSG
jgi:hypothetical protein